MYSNINFDVAAQLASYTVKQVVKSKIIWVQTNHKLMHITCTVVAYIQKPYEKYAKRIIVILCKAS